MEYDPLNGNFKYICIYLHSAYKQVSLFFLKGQVIVALSWEELLFFILYNLLCYVNFLIIS